MSSGIKPNCYVASPYGFAESTKTFYEGTLLPMLRRHVNVLDPWSVDVGHILSAPTEDRPRLWFDLGDHHYETIKTQAKLLIACLDQEPPDNGTVAEVVCAAENDIPVIGYRNDLRTAGEEGLSFNLMIGAAIRASGGVFAASLQALEDELLHPSTATLQHVFGG